MNSYRYTTDDSPAVVVPSLQHLCPIVYEISTYTAFFDWLCECSNQVVLLGGIESREIISNWTPYCHSHTKQFQLRVHEISSAVPSQTVLVVFLLRLDQKAKQFRESLFKQLARKDAAEHEHFAEMRPARTRSDKKFPDWATFKIGDVKEVSSRSRKSVYASIAQSRARNPDRELIFQVRVLQEATEDTDGRFQVTRLSKVERERRYCRQTKDKKRAQYLRQGKPVPLHLEPVAPESSYTPAQIQLLNKEIEAFRKRIRNGDFDDDPFLKEEFEADPRFYAEVNLTQRGEWPA